MKNGNQWLTAIAISCGLLACSSHAANYDVPGDFPTIQAAINAASNGDVINVQPGTYNEQINFLGKAISVLASGGVGDVILGDSSPPYTASGPLVTFKNGENYLSLLKGFDIVGADQAFDHVDSAPQIANCRIMHCGTSHFESWNNPNQPLLMDCTFQYNNEMLFDVLYTNMYFIGCTFTMNSRLSGTSIAYVDGGSLSFVGCSFSRNAGDSSLSGYYGNFSLDSCTFEDNIGHCVSAYHGWISSDSSSFSNTIGRALSEYECGVSAVNSSFCNSTEGHVNEPKCYQGNGNVFDDLCGSSSSGACCLNTGCISTSQAECLGAGGDFLGAGSSCEECGDPCPGDTDGNGEVDVLDLLNVIAAWGPCP